MADYVKDSFTEASDTPLASHTPDTTGTSWTEVYNTMTSGQAQVVASGDYCASDSDEVSVGLGYSAEPDPSSAEYVLECDILANPTGAPFYTFGLFARRTDNSNYYSAILTPVTASNDARLYKLVSGTPTELASGDTGTGTWEHLQFIVTDALKTIRVDGRVMVSNSDNALTSKGDCGLAWGDFATKSTSLDDVGSAWQIDNFRSYDIPQEANPDSDVSLGNWTDEGETASNVYQSIDEASGDDSDYAESGDSPNLDVLEVGLSNPTDPSTGEGHVVHFRYRKQGLETIDLRVRLLEGATERASWTYTDISSDWVYGREELTTTQANNISDYSNLRLEFRADVP